MTIPDPEAQQDTRTFLDGLWDQRTFRVLVTITIFVVVLAFLRSAHETLTLFLFAILFAYFLEPLVKMLEKPVRGRGKAILIVYTVLIGVLTAVGFIAGPSIADEGRQFTGSLPALLEKLSSGELIQKFGQAHHLKPTAVAQAQSYLVDHREGILGYGKVLGAKIAEPFKHIWWLILIPILSLFFLRQGNEIATAAVALGRSTTERDVIQGLLDDINVMLGSYIRAQITLASLTLVAYTLVLSLLGAPYAFILGPLAGFLEFIPVVGPAIGSIAIIVISVLAGYPHVLWLFIFLAVWRLTQDYVSAPRIMGRSLEINPLLQIFAVLSGGEIAGVVGALIAVPVAATLRIFARRLRRKQETAGVPAAAVKALGTP